MHKRTLLVIAPLFVVALAAGVAFAAPMAAEPDNPHAERPIAASPRDHTASSGKIRDAVAAAIGAYVRDAMLQEAVAYVHDIQAQQIGTLLDAIAVEHAAQARAAATVSRSSAPASGGNGGFLDCIKQRESRGDYTVHNYQGSGASGAYQFLPGTWNSIAESSGRSDLVGMDPAAAAPADQDAMAAELYAQQGSTPWGGAC
jgi:hypothetical protein